MLVYDPALDVLSGDEFVALPAVEEGEEQSEGDDETVNPVLPTGSDIVYAAIFFFALWAALKYVLLPPVNKVRAEREARIAAARDAADLASADMGSAQSDYDDAIAGARAEANAILETARAEADAHRAEVVGAAEAEAARIRSAAAEELEVARSRAIGALSNDVVEVATGAASRVTGQPVDLANARPIVERVLQGGNR